MSHLHGNHLMDLMSPSKEAFIRFVILVDLMRYHHHFSNEERKALANFMAGYEGEKVESPSSGLVPSPPPARSLSRVFVLRILLFICG
jgi:hypothetical protein